MVLTEAWGMRLRPPVLLVPVASHVRRPFDLKNQTAIQQIPCAQNNKPDIRLFFSSSLPYSASSSGQAHHPESEGQSSKNKALRRKQTQL